MITEIREMYPLSRSWTHEEMASEAMVLTNTIDNEKLQLANIRNHINIAITHIADLLNLSSYPAYNIFMKGTIEKESTLPKMHYTGLFYIDLQRPAPMECDTWITATRYLKGDRIVNSTTYYVCITEHTSGTFVTDLSSGYWVALVSQPYYVPLNIIHDIKRINVAGKRNALGTAWLNTKLWQGNVTKWDASMLTHTNWGLNVQHKQTLAWSREGSDILLFVGSDIEMVVTGGTPASPAIKPYMIDHRTGATEGNDVFSIIAVRQPLLDDLLAPNNSGTYRMPIDVPNQHVRLVLLLTQKMILEQLSEQVPANLTNEINSLTQQITSNLSNELQFEKANREKQNYGTQQRVPGA
jgi:hypothetical protein